MSKLWKILNFYFFVVIKNIRITRHTVLYRVIIITRHTVLYRVIMDLIIIIARLLASPISTTVDGRSSCNEFDKLVSELDAKLSLSNTAFEKKLTQSNELLNEGTSGVI